MGVFCGVIRDAYVGAGRVSVHAGCKRLDFVGYRAVDGMEN